MSLRNSGLLQSEVRHWLERWRERLRPWNLRGWVNGHPVIVIAVACLSTVLLTLALIRVFRSTGPTPFQLGKSAWFYDVNTKQLFTGKAKEAGPISAPSGPLPDGEPAGLRAHVYSYVLDPNESELFVGFLERPDPAAKTTRVTHDMSDFEAWVQGRLVKRPDDEPWVAATSPEGREILSDLLRPNQQGQTPLYQTPQP